MSPASTLFVALNPALEVTLQSPAFRLGAANRVAQPIEQPDGKAITAATVFKRFGGSPTVLCCLPKGRGALLPRHLQREKIPAHYVRSSGSLRRTYTLLAQNEHGTAATQILEPGLTLTEAEQRRITAKAKRLCQTHDICVLSGSLPGLTRPDLYAILIEEIRSSSPTTILLDTSGESLAHGAAAGPHILKVNREEFCEVTRTPTEPSHHHGTLIESFASTRGIDTLVVTDGPCRTYAWSLETGLLAVDPPKDLDVVNTVGSGDCFLAGFLLALPGGLQAALRRATALASANVTTLEPGSFGSSEADVIAQHIAVSRTR